MNLKEENEPEIFKAIKENALLENVKLNANNQADYSNSEKTENGRVSFPITPNWYEKQQGNHK